jgi:hypothetical protein
VPGWLEKPLPRDCIVWSYFNSINNPKESRKELLLEQFIKAGNKSSNVDKYRFWQNDSYPL